MEHGFTVPLHDPDTGEVLDEQLVGTMDLIVLEQGRRVVVEHKSASKKWSEDQLRFDIQVTGYRLAAREAGLGEVGVRLQVITKAKTPAVQVADLERDHQDEEDFVRTAVGVLRAVDSGVSFPVRGWACGSCPYAEACKS